MLGNEADIVITDPGAAGSFTWQSTGPGAAFAGAPFDFDNSQNFTGTFAGGIDPGAGGGAWAVEFIDSFDDGAGADSQSTNVDITFEEVDVDTDSSGLFSFNTLALEDTDSSEGEFVVGSLFDLYSITLTEGGLFDITTSSPGGAGFTGADADTEIALFDSAGILVATNDDDPAGGTFSALRANVAAGDYTIAVGAFDTVFADGLSVTGGGGTGDYLIDVSLTAVPEPASLSLIALAGIGLFVRRRRS